MATKKTQAKKAAAKKPTIKKKGTAAKAASKPKAKAGMGNAKSGKSPKKPLKQREAQKKANAKPAPKKPVSTAAAKTTDKAREKGKAAVSAGAAPSAKAAPAKAAATAPAKVAVSAPVKAVPAKATPSAPAKAVPAKAAPAKTAPPVAAAPAAAPVARPAKPSRPKPKGPILPRQFLLDLGMAIKEAIEPLVRSVRGRDVVGTAVSGDATFEIDRIAETTLMNYLRNARASVAYYSEDSGYSTFSNQTPKHLLIVDPIDGTRAAKNGFEGCVIAMASTRVIERPTMGDIDTACIIEIVGDRIFYAERGKGARVYIGDKIKRPRLSTNSNLETMTWAMTVPARPAELIFPTAARLIDLSSLKGGFFACNSTSYSLTRLLTNQLDAVVDFAARYYADLPKLTEDHFINAGRGAILGIAPYDMAASVLIAEEAGCHVTDAYGRKFDDVLLLDMSPTNMQSMIAASNVALHKKLLNFFDTRIKQYEALLKKRAGQLG